MYIFLILLFFLALTVFIYTLCNFHFSLKRKDPIKKQIAPKELKIESKYIKTADGIKISSWYMPVKKPKAVVILVHGYKETNASKQRMLEHAQYLKKAGYSTLLLDMRAFGESSGKKVSLGLHEWKDVEAVYNYVKLLPENKNKKIGFFGKSMGGVTSIIAKGVSGKGDFIIALTPYASFKNLFKFQLKQKGYFIPLFLPVLRVAAFFELGFDYEDYTAENQIKNINVPIFIAGAMHDERVPKNDAKYLYEKANSPKEFWQAPTSHDEIFRDDPEEFKKKILNFLEKYA